MLMLCVTVNCGGRENASLSSYINILLLLYTTSLSVCVLVFSGIFRTSFTSHVVINDDVGGDGGGGAGR